MVALQISSPAREGGDEFVLVLSEIGKELAQRVHARVRAELANDFTVPALSSRVQLAVCPVCGTGLTTMLQVADKSLYAMKRDHDLHLSPRRT